ncbi:VOC family protein [Streptomyces sp. NPDC101132]|uniref:VOC family protein n=1 Tax=Streptomyces sp. NPDC101132 TaxID=3366110 RepID=UPI0037FCA1F8
MLGESKAFSGFSVDSVEAARRFYGETLGLKVTDDEMGTLALHLGSGARVFLYPKENHTPASFTVLNFPVEDIERAVDELVARGIVIQRYEGFDQDEKGIARDEESGHAIAWFEDPAGNVLSVLTGP